MSQGVEGQRDEQLRRPLNGEHRSLWVRQIGLAKRPRVCEEDHPGVLRYRKGVWPQKSLSLIFAHVRLDLLTWDAIISFCPSNPEDRLVGSIAHVRRLLVHRKAIWLARRIAPRLNLDSVRAVDAHIAEDFPRGADRHELAIGAEDRGG